MNKFRTHNCSELSENEIDKNVILSGWLHRKRDHGNLLFADLRDHYGITQCVIENKSKFFPIIEKARPETVLRVEGKVVNVHPVVSLCHPSQVHPHPYLEE